MKQLLRVLLVMTLVLSMAAPALAAATDYTESISGKPSPWLLPQGTCEHGNTVYGWLLDENGNKVDCLCGKEIIVTPLYEFKDGEQHEALPQEVIDLIFQVYEDIMSGETDLADVHGLIESIKAELGKHADEEHLSIYELFDVTVIDRKTGEVWPIPEGHSLQLKFAVNLPVDEFLEVMSYADDHWQLAKLVDNQGDGILVIFDHLCPVAFLVEADDAPAVDEDDQDKPVTDQPSTGADDEGSGGSGDVAKTGDENTPGLWAALAAAALAGLGVLLGRGRKTAK